MRFAVNEIDKSHGSPKKNQKEIPDIWNIIISVKYLKFTFIRTSVNNQKNKCKAGVSNFFIKKVGRSNLLDDNLIKKVRQIAIETRQACGVINRRQIVSITNGIVRTNNPDILREFGGTERLTNR